MKVETIGVSAQKPSNVAVYLTATAAHRPLADLDSSAFRLSEDGEPLDPKAVRQVLLERTLVGEFRTVLLVDLTAGNDLNRVTQESLGRAAAEFVARVSRSQPVSVYAFSGDSRPVLLGEFPRSASESGRRAEVALKSFTIRGSSRDLRGALLAANRDLSTRLGQVQKPFRIGSLVVVARGNDLAGKVKEDQIEEALEKSKLRVVAVGVGEGSAARQWASAGYFQAESIQDVGPQLRKAAEEVAGVCESHYLIAYCSPARSGPRALKVEVTATVEGEEKKGRVVEEFDATGFAGGCNSRATPRFVPPPSSRADKTLKEAPPARGAAGSDEADSSPDEAPPSAEEKPKESDQIVPPPNTRDYGR